MQQLYSWSWIEAQVAQTIEAWKGCASNSARSGPRYTANEQEAREAAYDEALATVEREIKKTPLNKADRAATQDRLIASFGRFSASALDLNPAAVELLTKDFLPVGTTLAQWARRFDANLSMADIIQACRNAWTACGLQPLLGEPVKITPSILGYSLLYPYSDNYLDREDISAAAKLSFSERFQRRLCGDIAVAQNDREAALWRLVSVIEAQYPRARYAAVFDCLLAIHRAQEESIAQLARSNQCSDDEVLRMSCAKGGSSVLADACLARGWLDEKQRRFSFEWGVLLQLGDDLQDVHEDLRRGSVTLFSRAAAQGVPLDGLAIRLLNFSEAVGTRMDLLPHGTSTLKELLKMSWRSLIVRAVADSHEFFSPQFLEEAESRLPFALSSFEFGRTD
jgi:hypothetical protein